MSIWENGQFLPFDPDFEFVVEPWPVEKDYHKIFYDKHLPVDPKAYYQVLQSVGGIVVSEVVARQIDLIKAKIMRHASKWSQNKFDQKTSEVPVVSYPHTSYSSQTEFFRDPMYFQSAAIHNPSKPSQPGSLIVLNLASLNSWYRARHNRGPADLEKLLSINISHELLHAARRAARLPQHRDPGSDHQGVSYHYPVEELIEQYAVRLSNPDLVDTVNQRRAMVFLRAFRSRSSWFAKASQL